MPSPLPASRPFLVVGGGIGGLAAAVDLAARDLPVVLLEKEDHLGGKVRTVDAGGLAVDSGPTVLTMRHVFAGLFADAGADLDARVPLVRAGILARHAWPDGTRLDLHADPAASRAAIAEVFGPREAEGFDRFRAHCQGIYEEVADVFIHSQRPGMWEVARTYGLSALTRLSRIDAHRSVWKAVQAHFDDPRLQQLFGRYATYSGASPFQAPGTLNLIAHVEQEGVWYVQGGMHRLATALADLARERGVEIRTGTPVAALTVDQGRATGVRLADGSHLDAQAVVFNGDVSALAAGHLGPEAAAALGRSPVPPPRRSLSALTLSLAARTSGFPLVHHNVFFSDDYRAEFADIFGAGRLPADPTVYLCAQDRKDARAGDVPAEDAGPERLFLIINAPARGDHAPFPDSEVHACEQRTMERLARAGLEVAPVPGGTVTTRPRDFERLFPGTGGALYGAAAHSWRSSFDRSGARTRLPGLYLAGGSVHPGAGVPMVAISGRLAAAALAEDLAASAPLPSAPRPSTSTSAGTATPGGTSTSSPRTASTA